MIADTTINTGGTLVTVLLVLGIIALLCVIVRR